MNTSITVSFLFSFLNLRQTLTLERVQNEDSVTVEVDSLPSADCTSRRGISKTHNIQDTRCNMLSPGEQVNVAKGFRKNPAEKGVSFREAGETLHMAP